ncbi:hypothetical protein K435DRAFT_791107 [Dendrothele bispora CBS 962.96]|uniref:Uncharacterized protein n=1 Tax=Dendrothele bispora (strain CBS 962.96) TaxID=1314807 RepID=A0A4S8MN46_DENBC|nr:hypothetical protein K435DRAFT_791107 [Dendrothele bispora CBS 962.96]
MCPQQIPNSNSDSDTSPEPMDIEPFMGDGSNPRENPHNFLPKWQLSLSKLKKDAEEKEKILSFQLYCSVGSAADEWFDELDREQKSSMASFMKAFEQRKPGWNTKWSCWGTKEDVGKRVNLYGQEVFTHVAFASVADLFDHRSVRWTSGLSIPALCI